MLLRRTSLRIIRRWPTARLSDFGARRSAAVRAREVGHRAQSARLTRESASAPPTTRGGRGVLATRP
jgi:hypothetical protein